MTKKTSSWDDEGNEVASNWVKFNVPMYEETKEGKKTNENHDKIFGTLIAKRQMKSTIPGKESETVNVYDMKAEMGTFHEADEKKVVIPEVITINAGDIWSIGGKAGIDAQMRNIKVGQKIGFKFIDEKPSKTKGFAPAKNIRVYAPKNEDGTPQMDNEFLAQEEVKNF